MIDESHIVYNDKYISVLNKPHGLQCEPDRYGYPDLCTEWRKYLNKKDRPPKMLQPVNRLDRPVAGLVLFAKTSTALRELGKMQENREIHKEYTALVEGKIVPDEGLLEHYLYKDLSAKKAIVSTHPIPEGKPCKLSYRTIGSDSETSRLRVVLHTGRYHQIRTQLSFVGHPIVGDVYYGSSKIFMEHAICLHATGLAFEHPISGEKISLQSTPFF